MTHTKPIAAVTADTLLAEMKPINQKHADYAPRPLLDALGKAGFAPIILAYNDHVDPAAYVDLFDALVLPGGPNPTPRFYGEEPLWCIGPTFEKRDAFEMALIHAAMERKKPILGICRGMQILNVALGGTLWQDMSVQKESGSTIQHMQRAPGDIATHTISIEPGSRLGNLFGTSIRVNSRHREGIKTLAPGLTVTARAADCVIEAVEGTDSDLLAAVQWHPENMGETMAPLFTAFYERTMRWKGKGE